MQERLRQLQVGFFGETLDLADGPVVRYLDIAVARFRTGGLDADGHQSRPVVDEVEAFADDGAEILLVEDQVIRRGDDHLRSRIALLQSVGCITDAGSRVASDGFAEYLFRPEFRDLFQHEVFVAGVGHDQEIFSRSQFFETLVMRINDLPVPRISRNCLGLDWRLLGQKRLPMPPAMMTQ